MSAALAPASAQATVVVYAVRLSEARSWTLVRCNGAAAAELRRGSFFELRLDAGRHLLEIDGGVPLVLEAKPGEEHFVRLNWNHQVGRAPIAVLSAIGKEAARRELMHLVYVEARRIHSPQVTPHDPRPVETPHFSKREAR